MNQNIDAVNATIGDVSTLNAGTGSVGNALSNGNGTQPTTIVSALNNIDATLGQIHGLKAGNSDLKANSNLADGTTVEQHLVALDNAIGNRTYTSTNQVAAGSSVAVAVSAMVSLLNFVIFFLMTRNYKRISPVEIGRKKKYKRAVKIQSRPNNRLHTCAVCGRTSETNPELSFRYCSKCNGNFEYCQDHLFTHEHKK